MKTPLHAVAALTAALLLPAAAAAQAFAIGGRAGTLGVGAEAAVQLSDRLALRGGLGLTPVEPNATIDDIDFTLNLPSSWFNLGADLYLSHNVRVGGGVLFKTEDPSVEGRIRNSVEIGNETYTSDDVSMLRGTLDSRDTAPYVLLGFGRHAAQGVGLFLDLGVAFVGEPEVSLRAEGDPTVVNSAEFQAELRRQEENTEHDVGSYLKLWPILSFGVKVGIGAR